MNGLTCMTRLYYAPYTPTAMPGLWGKPQLLADELRYKENLPETMAGLLETLAGLQVQPKVSQSHRRPKTSKYRRSSRSTVVLDQKLIVLQRTLSSQL